MASDPLLGVAGEKHKKKLNGRKNQNNSNSVPQYYHPNERQKSSQQRLANTTDYNSSQPQTHRAVSDDSSSHNLEQSGGAQHSREHANAIEIAGYSKFDNLVKINLNLRNRDEVRALKRKLTSELDQVLSLVKRLEATQRLLSKNVNRNSMRMSSEMGSVEPTNPRSFRGSTVSVSENENNLGVKGEMVDKVKRAPKVNQQKEKFDALVGRERSTPMESNKKLKSSELGGGCRLDQDLSRLFKNCSYLLERLMKHKFGWVFNKPVDVKGLGLHDYYTIIKHPMDLGTVKVRLTKKLYKSPKEFAEDVRLTFNNAILYNPKGQDVHVMAEQLLKIFEEKWAKIEAEYSFSGRLEMGNDSGLPTSTSRTTPVPLAPACTPAPVPAPATPFHIPVPTPTPVDIPVPALSPQSAEVRNFEKVESIAMHVDQKTIISAHQVKTLDLKKPEAKDPEMRDMTYEEKQRLSLNLQDLPSDKLDHVVQIIKKRNPVLSQQDDEIEVDIDSFDPATLWELDRFVNNYKKSLTDNRRKAEFALQETAKSDHNILDTNMELIVSELPKGTEAVVKKIVSTSSPVQGEKQGDNY
ncbi:transcription factor GTE4-like isoform X3 [Mangifera indica]|uniref:transcription factor GTE4-like isoform X3 n=1 Tax=Mangifera indica TaxID=29780 RepID=UPI001CFA245D|nr:transcription factor GTE4-like isoform X3 [Mangifera indica]